MLTPVRVEISADAVPLARGFADLQIGDRCIEHCRLSADGLAEFARLSGDTAPVHTDEHHARSLGFEDRILPGFYTTLRFSRLMGMFVPGPLSVIHSTRFEFSEPVYIDGTGAVAVRYEAVIVRTIESLRAVELDLEARVGERLVVRGTGRCMMTR